MTLHKNQIETNRLWVFALNKVDWEEKHQSAIISMQTEKKCNNECIKKRKGEKESELMMETGIQRKDFNHRQAVNNGNS